MQYYAKGTVKTIPTEAELVILPTNDPDLCAINKKMADALVKRGKKVVVVEIEKPKIVIPKIELLAV